MAGPGSRLDGQLALLTSIAARVPGGLGGLTCAQDADLVELLGAAQAVTRSAQGVVAAGEVARRSEGDESLAKRHGARNARALVMDAARIGYAEAARAVEVG